MGEKTPAKKFDDGKPPLALISWPAVWEEAKVLAFGVKKYDAWNWENGLPHSRTLGAALRHITAYLSGETYDSETGINHLAHARCELMFALTFDLQGRVDLDDRPDLLGDWDMYDLYKGVVTGKEPTE